MRIVSLGHAVFALMMIAIGIVGFVSGDFAAIWQPVPKATPARDMLIYLTAAVSLVTGAGLLWRGAAGAASAILFLFLLAWMVLFKVPFIVHGPLVPVSYETTAETAVLVAAAWVLFAWLAADWGRGLGFITGDNGVRLARVLYALSMIAFGIAHFAYLEQTAPLIPNWIPAHEALAYFTGGTYIAAGVAILTGVLGRLAASLSVVQVGLFTALVWGPMIAAGQESAPQWVEFVVSCAITAAALVVAESYRGAPWFGTTAR